MDNTYPVLTDEILEASKRSFSFFMEAILGYVNPPFLNKLDDIISNFTYRKVVVAYPRQHGKSTHLSIGYPLWRIAQNHNLRILVTSKTATISSGFLRGVLNHIEDNSKYQTFAKYCDPKGVGIVPKMSKQYRKEEKWSSNAITIDRDDLSLKDPTIQTIGLFGSIIGRRADEIIGDDIVDQKNSETEDQKQKTKDWVYTTLLPVLDPQGRLIYAGNTWAEDDLVSDFLKDPQFDFRNRLKSIVTEPNNADLWAEWAKIRLDESVDPKTRMEKSEVFYGQNKEKMEEGTSVLWAEKFPYKSLYLLRLSNSYAFSRMYQCDPSLRPDQLFREVWLNKAREKGKDLILQDAVREGFTMDLTTSGLDLAISLKNKSDDTVLFTLDRVKYGNDVIQPGDFVIRNIRRGKYTPNEVRTMIKIHNDTVKPLGIRIESVAYQESMIKDLWDMGQINVRGHRTGGEKYDLEFGINSLSILLEIGKLAIPYNMSDPRTIQLCNQLINEMRSWPEGHTGDSLMAMWFAYLEAKKLMGKRFIIPTDITNPLYARPLDLKSVEVQTQEYNADTELIEESDKQRQRGRFVF